MMARKRAKGLSERQKKILLVLESFQIQNGYPPSIREICDKAAISSTSVVNYYLDQLQEMNYIERDDRISRGIRLVKPLNEIEEMEPSVVTGLKQVATSARQAIDDLLHVPLMGRIAAGLPLPVFPDNNSDILIDVARSMLPKRDKGTDLYALEVQGDSMIDAMVNDGDIVIMRHAHEAHNGEMVAVWLNDRDETTLKYFYLENGHVRLQPANPTMEPIYIEDPSIVNIQGKVVMVIRQVNGLAS